MYMAYIVPNMKKIFNVRFDLKYRALGSKQVINIQIDKWRSPLAAQEGS